MVNLLHRIPRFLSLPRATSIPGGFAIPPMALDGKMMQYHQIEASDEEHAHVRQRTLRSRGDKQRVATREEGRRRDDDVTRAKEHLESWHFDQIGFHGLQRLPQHQYTSAPDKHDGERYGKDEGRAVHGQDRGKDDENDDDDDDDNDYKNRRKGGMPLLGGVAQSYGQLVSLQDGEEDDFRNEKRGNEDSNEKRGHMDRNDKRRNEDRNEKRGNEADEDDDDDGDDDNEHDDDTEGDDDKDDKTGEQRAREEREDREEREEYERRKREGEGG